MRQQKVGGWDGKGVAFSTRVLGGFFHTFFLQRCLQCMTPLTHFGVHKIYQHCTCRYGRSQRKKTSLRLVISQKKVGAKKRCFPKFQTETPRCFSPNPDHHKLRISGFANLAFGISRIRWAYRKTTWLVGFLVDFFETKAFPFKKKSMEDGWMFINETKHLFGWMVHREAKHFCLRM